MANSWDLWKWFQALPRMLAIEDIVVGIGGDGYSESFVAPSSVWPVLSLLIFGAEARLLESSVPADAVLELKLQVSADDVSWANHVGLLGPGSTGLVFTTATNIIEVQGYVGQAARYDSPPVTLGQPYWRISWTVAGTAGDMWKISQSGIAFTIGTGLD